MGVDPAVTKFARSIKTSPLQTEKKSPLFMTIDQYKSKRNWIVAPQTLFIFYSAQHIQSNTLEVLSTLKIDGLSTKLI